jgi:hypothetical protein
MRHAAGKLADRFHFLRLPQMLLGLRQRRLAALVFGDVAGDAIEQFTGSRRGPGKVAP